MPPAREAVGSPQPCGLRPRPVRHPTDERGLHMASSRAGGIAIANAPVSYGAFELTVGTDPNVPSGASVLQQVAAAGYAGIDLGPAGYLGSGGALGETLAAHGLGLAGAYLELPYADHDALQRPLPDLDAML